MSTERFNPLLLYVAWVVALIATLGSLYFSEIKEFVPCEYCWYQRILMYPLAIILGIAAYVGDWHIKRYALPFSMIGMGVSSYHYATQKVPGFGPLTPCTGGVPCNIQYIHWFGFVTIPFLAFIAFTLITILLFVMRTKK
ncbi:disulfide bond formation protein B [Bacillaceae bacterium SIJ1]|uniref:disulfide oxidoreductase n=1 Tax=Litoribacterium kuwaitense TaxID=1398745 RepID=UPI0013EBDA58|nr:disulfide oxidoreductase [Litoribacterium kuwaitense]NGP45056.1 disulfide bond formation protein B [Litoribacterium kuwaitense]